MTTKARQLAELIANSLVDSDEISTGAVTTSKLADTLDFSSKTMVMADNQLSGDKIHGGTVSAFASTGIDDNASATAVTIASDGKVGIGTTSPSRLLTVSPSTGSAQIGLISQDSSLSEVLFGDVADDNVGRVYYDHASNSMSLWTNAAERMRIDASGNLLVGKTAKNTDVAGGELRSDGAIYGTRNSNFPMLLNRLTNDGDIISFRKDGSVVGSIGATVGDIYIDGPAGHSGIRLQASSLLPRYNGSDTNGTMDLGYYVSGVATHRWRNLYLSNSIANPSGNLKLAASGDITLESNSGYIWFNDDDITIGYLKNESTDLSIYVHNQSRDMLFKGNDDGSTITALTLDMSDAGKATFNNGLIANGDITNTISGTYNLNGANGTAGSPAYATYSFKDDPNTGMYRAAADTLAFTTAGSERLRINSSGRQSYNGTAYAIAHGNFVGEVASSGYRALSFEHTVGGGEVGSIRTSSSTAVYYGDGSQLTGVGGSTTFGAVGTYIWGRPFNGTNYAINATASSLYAITSHISAYGGQGYFRTGVGWQASPSQTAVSGTWRHMGGAGSSVVSSTDWGMPGLWVRIS